MKKAFFALMVIGLTAQLFAGAKKEETPAGVTELLVGTTGSPSPYGWVNPDGTLDGYDSAVIKALQAELPQYRLTVEKTEFASIFTGLDAGRYQIGINNISWRAEREAKYLYSKNHYIYNNTGLTVRHGRTDIKGIADLGGKSTISSAQGLFSQMFIEEYNSEHPDNPIKVTYSDEDALKTWQSIQAGTVDFSLLEEALYNGYRKEFGIDNDFISLPKAEQEKVQNPKSYIIFPRTERGEAIRADVDAALERLIQNGTLSRLAVQFFGSDISQ